MILDRTPAHLTDMLGFYRLGEEASKTIPGMPWRQIIGLRNILAHGYDQVAVEVLFNTIINDLPAVESSLRQLIDVAQPN